LLRKGYVYSRLNDHQPIDAPYWLLWWRHSASRDTEKVYRCPTV